MQIERDEESKRTNQGTMFGEIPRAKSKVVQRTSRRNAQKIKERCTISKRVRAKEKRECNERERCSDGE